ncbi:copper chaperone PCu(A)C [Undibacterium arcticum]|uniref:Copper chaperone PCu(A)C n=1 Tax=Undibacterium arcticum TaxID=1762892 RepID=A0ABV7F459_9BURK
MPFRKLLPLLLLPLLAIGIGANAQAHDYHLHQLHVMHPYARSTVPNQPTGVVYMTIENKGDQADQLISMETPIASSVEMHSMSMDGNVMRMRAIDSLELKPASTTTLKPGDGYHIMLIGLKQPLKAGDKFPLLLRFKKTGEIGVAVWVEQVKAEANGGAMSEHHHH